MRRGWFIGAIVVGIAVIVAAVVIAKIKGNSNPTSVEPTNWANSVCMDLSDWKSSLESLANVSGGTLTKASLEQKLEEAQTATDELAADLEGLGPPDLEAGDQLKQELASDADQLQSSYQALKAGAQDALSKDTVQARASALAALAPDYQKLLNEISATVTNLQNANVAGSASTELKQAFQDADACKSLRAES